jgi:hypothetical protein
VLASFDEQQHQNPNGPIRCDSGPLTFSLKRR